MAAPLSRGQEMILPTRNAVRSLLVVLRKICRWLFVAVVTVAVVTTLTFIALNYWLNSGIGKDVVRSVIAEQTGAVVGLESIQSHLPRGGVIRGLSLRLPLENASQHEKEPSIVVREVRVRMSLSSFLYGTFRIKEAVVDGLEIHAARTDGVLWTSGLVNYLAARAKPKPAEPTPTQDENKKPMQVQDIEDIVRKIFIPLRIKIELVGLKSMRLTFKDRVKGKLAHDLSLGPVDALFGMTAWLRSSHLWMRLSGEGESGAMQFNYQGHGKKPIVQEFDFRTDLTFDDWNHLQINAKSKNLPEDLNLKIDVKAVDNYRTIRVQPFSVSVGKILSNTLEGSVQFVDDRFDLLNLDIGERANINLKEVNPHMKQFGVETAGTLELRTLQVRGLLDIQSLSTLETARLPQVQVDFGADNVSVQHALAQLTNLNMQISATVQPSKAGGASLRHGGRVSIESLRAWGKGQVKNSTPLLAVSDLQVETKIEAADVTDVKNVGIQNFTVKTSIANLAVKPPAGGLVQTNLNALVRADTARMLETINFNATVDIGKLLDAAVKLSCLNSCQHIKFTANADIPHIDRLVALVTPAIGQVAAQLPVIGGGSLRVDANVTGTTPAGTLDKLADRLRKAKGNVRAEVHLKDLDVAYTPAKVAANGISTDLVVRGAIEKQSLEVEVGIKSLQTAALPKPLLDNLFLVSVKVENLAKITVDRLNADIPSLGTAVKADAAAEISDTKEPRNIIFNLSAVVAPEKVAAGMVAIDASGEAKAELHVSSKTLSEVEVSGLAALTQFSAKIPQPKEAGTDVPLVSVEGMNGVFPFRQSVNLDEIKAKAAAAKAEADALAKKQSGGKDSEAEEGAAEEAPVEAVKEPALEDRLTAYLEKHRDSKVLADNRMKAESYGEVRPTTQRIKPITAERMAFKDLAMTGIEIDAELTQNMFSLNQIVFNLLGGKVQATAQVSFDTTLRKARVTGQCTELDTRKLADSFPKLKDKMQSFSLLGSSPYIDGTMRLLYDAPSGDIAGGFEITRIGKDQMRAVLLYVDPDETNPTIGTMRKALAIGEVRQVSVPIRNGQIGLDLDVRVFGAPIPTPKLQRFPLAQLVRNFTSQKSATKSSGTATDKKEEVNR